MIRLLLSAMTICMLAVSTEAAPGMGPSAGSALGHLMGAGPSGAVVGGTRRMEGPIIVGNGGGVGEFYLFYALRTMPTLIDVCLAQPACASGIDANLRQMKSAEPWLSTTLSLQTSSELGSHLFTVASDGTFNVNKDLLFNDQNGVKVPWQYGDAAAFFASAWSARLGWSPAIVASVGGRLNQIASAKSTRFPQSEMDLRQFSLVLVEAPFSAVVIEDDSRTDSAQTLEVPFVQDLTCEASGGGADSISDLKVLNTHWGPAYRDPSGDSEIVPIMGLIQYRCMIDGVMTLFSSQYRVSLPVRRGGGAWTIDTSSISIEQNGIQELP